MKENKHPSPSSTIKEGEQPKRYATELEYIQRPKEDFLADQIKNNIIPTGYTGKRLEMLKWAFNLGAENGINWQIHNPQKAEGEQQEETELPIFNQGGWISTLVAIPRPDVEVEYYWRNYLDEERIYKCKFEVDDDYFTFIGTVSFHKDDERFWRPLNWQKTQQPKGEQEALFLNLGAAMQPLYDLMCQHGLNLTHDEMVSVLEICRTINKTIAIPSMETKERLPIPEPDDYRTNLVGFSYPIFYEETLKEYANQQTTTLQAEIEALKAENERFISKQQTENYLSQMAKDGLKRESNELINKFKGMGIMAPEICYIAYLILESLSETAQRQIKLFGNFGKLDNTLADAQKLLEELQSKNPSKP